MTGLDEAIEGRVWVVGDSVDTSQLAGSGLKGRNAADTLRINCLRGARPDFTDGVRLGDILVAGTNFGCGSSRQAAVEALLECGVVAVLAESVARIHRRNSIALALPTFAVPGITSLVREGQTLRIDYPARLVRNKATGAELPLASMPSGVEEIYRAGGMMSLLRLRLAAEGVVPPPALTP